MSIIMNSKNCLNSKKLIEYLDGNLNEKANQEIIDHLVKCEKCTRNLNTLTRLDEMLNMKDKKLKDDIYPIEKSGNCVSDELLYRFLEGMVTESEAEIIEKHVNSCQVCFSEMASIAKNSLSPITDFEKSEITKLRIITRDEQLSKILEYCGQAGEKPEKGKKVKIAVIIKERVKDFFEKWINTKYIWKPAIVFSILIFFIAGIYSGIRYYNTSYQIYQAEKLLQNKHRIYIENPRLSGGYGSKGIGMLMGHEADKLSYVEQSKSKLNKAIEKGSKSLQARQLLAQAFIIEEQNAKADSIFKTIGDTVKTSAALLNDIGVLNFQKGDLKKAALNFESALAIEKDFAEAYYNLALVKIKLQQLSEAIIYLEKYLKLEDNKDWNKAAQSLINRINKNDLMIY